jgi:two-component system nitrate/nitrite response regulator NarL
MFSLTICGPAIYRTALYEQLRAIRSDIMVASQSNHVADAPALIARSVPDAAIMISGGDALAAISDASRIRRVDLDVKLIWWALSSDAVQLSRQLRPYDVAVLSWEASPEDMFNALGIPMSPLLRTPSRPKLTPQEHLILQFAADGLSNRAIAHRLAVSESTVKNHLRHISAKFNTSSRAQAVWQAVQWGYLAAKPLAS